MSDSVLALSLGDDSVRTFNVNAAPIMSDDGKHRGTLASFNDVTALEAKKDELMGMLETLRESREEIQEQNAQLQYLATRDPLTGCLNRRSFFELFEKEWSAAQRYGQALSCIMVDIDHFKSINDTHGHSVGDTVLKKVAVTMLESARDTDIVCRYGGEEFVILLPHLGVDEAFTAAERFRQIIEAIEFPQLSVTASLGLSAASLGAPSTQDMLDEADKCLYVAKRGGRNQVIHWDAVPDDIDIDESEISRTVEVSADDSNVPIPFHAVTALMSALAYRESALGYSRST